MFSLQADYKKLHPALCEDSLVSFSVQSFQALQHGGQMVLQSTCEASPIPAAPNEPRVSVHGVHQGAERNAAWMRFKAVTDTEGELQLGAVEEKSRRLEPVTVGGGCVG